MSKKKATPEIPSALPEDRFVLALPTFTSPSGARVLPAGADLSTLLAARDEAKRDIYASDRVRNTVEADCPVDIPRQYLFDTTDALIRWGIAAAELERRADPAVRPIDKMAADVAQTALRGPGALAVRAEKLLKLRTERGRSFYYDWMLDRIAVCLLAAAPEAASNPATHEPFVN